jgi:hypothetical protein
MKRLVWFSLGVAAGAAAPAYAKRKARAAAERYRPVNMAKGAVDRVAEAVREGRAAMAAREAQLRTSLDESSTDGGEARPGVVVEAVEVDTVALWRAGRAGPRRRSRR